MNQDINKHKNDRFHIGTELIFARIHGHLSIVGLVLTFLLLVCFESGCKKFVEAPLPITALVSQAVYNSNATAAAAVTGIYETMVNKSIGGGSNGLSALPGLSADDFTLYPNAAPLQEQVYLNAQSSTNTPPIWSDLYNVIYQANSAISGITSSAGITTSMKHQLIGEAKFIRAFCYFYLVNLYGDVPLSLTPDYQQNAKLARTSQLTVYQQIIGDLDTAQSMLSDNYLAPNGTTTTERVRPNKGVATALLARVYLYYANITGDASNYAKAEQQSTAVINNSNYNLPADLNTVFLSTSTEAIWQLEPPNNGFNTQDGQAFLLSAFGGPSASHPYVLNNELLNDFEPGDLRVKQWTSSITVNGVVYYFPYKYKLAHTGSAPTEYPTLLRLAEQYLIRAEARAQQGDLNGAQSDINAIRNRAGLPPTSATTLDDIMNAIQQERRVELFTEYGYRWLDLKRWHKVDSVMSVVTPQKGGQWVSSAALYPIPLTDIQYDANLTQNLGYN